MLNTHAIVPPPPPSPARGSQLQKTSPEEFTWLNIQVLSLPFGENMLCLLSVKKIALSAVRTSPNPCPFILSK